MHEQHGELLVKIARKAIEEYLEKSRVIKAEEHFDIPEELKKKRGVFVTLLTYPEKELRGCIGYAEPVFELHRATVDAAISAATRDPRFPPLKINEIEKTLVEVTVLTPPELIEVDEPGEYLKKIEIGRHGLIIERGLRKGLLLPQVPVEQNWNAKEYLCYLCLKAGLEPSAWLSREARIYCFEGVIFEEIEPKGKVVKREIGACK